MYIYVPNMSPLCQKLSEVTGIECSSEMNGPPSAILLVRKNRNGGVEDPVPHITSPGNTLVIAGIDDDRGMAFAGAAISAGVPENNILFMSKEQGLSFKFMGERLAQLVNTSSGQESENMTWEDDPGSTIPASQPGRVKVISILGFRGGVGRTTIAMSLATHYADIGERVAVLDLGSPPAAYRYARAEVQEQEGLYIVQGDCHIYFPAVPVWQLTREYLQSVMEQLRANYRRIIVDLPAQPVDGHLEAISPERVVVVMDHDVTQTIDPAAELRGQAVFVYNRAIRSTDVDLVSGIVGAPLVVIKDDPDGCQAALVANDTAYRTSEEITRGIGEIAGHI